MTRARLAAPFALVLAMLAFGSVDPRQLAAQVRSGVVMGPPPRSGPRPDGTGSVRGRVVDGASGQALRDVTVTATWRAADGAGDARFFARTDAQGMFTMEQLPDGSYVVHAQRQGFHEGPGARPGPREVALRDGASVDIGDVRLVRGGVLTGRVLDEHGEPVVGAMVTPVGRHAGGDVWMVSGSVSRTDDRGVYRAHGLMAGTYTVRVVPTGPSGRGPLRLQGDEPELLPAFATAASELAGAEFGEVRPGEETLLDVRLPGGRLARVAGRVVADGEPVTSSGADIALRPVEGGGQLRLAGARMLPDGQFEFLDVAPGRYRVVVEEPMVFTPNGPARRRAGWADVAVSGDAVTDIMVPIGFGSTLRGRIEVDGGDAGALAERPLHVTAATVPGRTPVPSGAMHSTSTTDLTFELRDVLGFQQLSVTGLPKGWWVKSVLIEGEDAWDGRLFPASGLVDGVVLLVSSRQSGVSGRVEGRGEALQGASVLVLPAGSVNPTRGSSSDRRIASVSLDGSFTVEGLRPGRYALVALSPRMRSVYDRLAAEARQAVVDRHGQQLDIVEGRLAAVTLSVAER